MAVLVSVCTSFSCIYIYIMIIVRTAGKRKEFCVVGRLVDGDDTKMKLENLAVSGSRRDQLRLSISRVLWLRFAVIAISCAQAQNWRPPISRIVVQYLESLQPIRSSGLDPLTSVKQNISFRRTSCLSKQQQFNTWKPLAEKLNLLAGGNCILQL
jgi:hypothetical protein